MSTLVHDLRVSVRSLLRSPAFTTVAVLSLAVGIGINTVMFSIVDGVLLKQLPYPDSGQLVSVVGKAQGIGDSKIGLSPAEYLRLRQQSQTLSRSGAYFGGIFPIYASFRDVNNPRRFRYGIVTADLFPALGYQPILGRNFQPSDAPLPVPGQAPPTQGAVILSYGLWQSQFGGDPKVLNTVITVSGFPRLVLGIMPPEFHLPVDLVNDEKMEAWFPLTINETNPEWTGRALSVVGRLRLGKQLSEYLAEIGVLEPRLHQERPEAYPAAMKHSLRGMPLRDDLVGDIRPTLLLLMGAVGLVLLIACMNVASLLLARATGRQKEMALRATLGATRGRLVRQLFTEALLVAAAAAGGGLLLANWCLRLMLALTPVGALPRAGEVALDWRVLVFTLAVSVLAALLFGLVPALQVSRFDLNRVLRQEGRSATGGVFRQRLRSALVIGEITLAFVLVIGAGLLLRSFSKLLRVDPGFNPHNVLRARVSLPIPQYPGNGEAMAFYSNFRQHMQTLPGVNSASGVDVIPVAEPSGDTMFEIEGRPFMQDSPASREQAFPHLNLRLVLPGYFETMQIRLLQGRFLAEADREDSSPVAVINETLARRFFAGEKPTGKRLRLYFSLQNKTSWVEIVGVFADSKIGSLDEDPKPEIVLAAGQLPKLFGQPGAIMRIMSLLVKFKTPAMLTPTQFREEIKTLDPLLSISVVEPLDELIARTLARPRFIVTLLGAFAAVAFLLAVIGIYGLISYSVTQRTREIGIRMALGAQHGSILKLIVGQGSLLAVIGVVIGLAASLALTRVIRSLLFGVSAMDPATFAAATLVLLTVAALASYIPARRATRVDPTVALRAE